ncbi:MAG: amino acid kinase family protein, partial [Candidatus Ranarchaeia archaeon]
LAIDTKADIFLILTDVDAVYLNYGKPDQKKLSKMSVAEAEMYFQQGHFAAGSMGPKVLAASKFIKDGGKKAIIASLEHALDALDGKSGTEITR